MQDFCAAVSCAGKSAADGPVCIERMSRGTAVRMLAGESPLYRVDTRGCSAGSRGRLGHLERTFFISE